MKQIKSISALILAVVMLLCLMACGTGGNTEKPAPASEAAEAPAEAAEAAAPEEVYTLVFSFHDPDTNTQNTEIFQPYFEKITEETDGRVQFECHYNGELVGLGEAYDAVAKGTVDIAVIRDGTLPYCPILTLIENPPLTGSNCTRSSYVLNQLADEYPELENNFPGIKFMLRYQMTYGYLGTTASCGPIETYDDLSGKTLIIGSALAADRLSAYGGTPLDVLPPDFYTSLEKGLADGAMTVTQPEMVTYSWSDVVKNVTLVPVIHAVTSVVINQEVWESLPADIQEIIEGLNGYAVDLADTAMNEANDEAIATLKSDYDTTFVEPSEDLVAAMYEADQDVYAEYIQNLKDQGMANAEEIYARYMELYEEYSE